MLNSYTYRAHKGGMNVRCPVKIFWQWRMSTSTNFGPQCRMSDQKNRQCRMSENTPLWVLTIHVSSQSVDSMSRAIFMCQPLIRIPPPDG